MSTTTPRPQKTATEVTQRWYRVPFVWFAIALFLAILAACVHLIVISIEADDPSVLEREHERVFRVPAAAETSEPQKPPHTPAKETP